MISSFDQLQDSISTAQVISLSEYLGQYSAHFGSKGIRKSGSGYAEIFFTLVGMKLLMEID